jgi:acetyl esterase/lipase
VAIIAQCAMAQSECVGGRYIDPDHFDNTVVTYGVLFGWNIGVGSSLTDSLQMDIYEPAGDTLPERPVVLVGFGGSFISGTRADVAPLCQAFAHLGYVAIALDYRVGVFWPNTENTTQAVMRGAHDFRACIRYLRKTVQQDGNPYRIDPDRILSGGVSAGAIAALHAIYLDQPAEVPQVLWNDTAALGGIEGNSGSPGYSSKVRAGWSMSGALGDTSWIVPGDMPLVSVHETADDVVPCWTEPVEIIGLPSGVVASGSGHIHRRMDHLGVENCFLLYPGNGHVGYLSNDEETTMAHVTGFMADIVCASSAGCTPQFASISTIPPVDRPILVPNPVVDLVRVETPHPAEGSVLDLNGSVVATFKVVADRTTIDLSHLPSGVYIVRLSGSVPRQERLVKL